MSEELRELERARETIQARRRARAEADQIHFIRQEVADLERIDQLEEEHGDNRVRAAPLEAWSPKTGGATRIAVVAPKREDHHYQRFQRLIWQHRKNPTGATKAIEQLGRMALAYPHPENDKELFETTLSAAAALLSDAADLAVELCGIDAEADAKKSRTR